MSNLLKQALGVAGAALLLTIGAMRADAGLIISAPNITVTPGSTGAFDVTLTNTGNTTVYIGGFSFEISTSNPDIGFTGVTVNTVSATYIFPSADSLNGPNILATASPFAADDVSVNPSGDAIGAGQTLGLGNVTYAVTQGSPLGLFSITFSANQFTALSDVKGNAIPNTTLSNGSIDVTTPEPSSILLTLCGLAAFIGSARRKRA